MEKKIKILLVEDNEGDIVLTRRALTRAKMGIELFVVRDGDEALQYLKKEGIFQYAETPDLILLDINLPRVNGIEVLAEIKNHETLRLIPVVMLTTSDAEEDIAKAYYHHVNAYVAKPADFKTFMEIIMMIKNCWFGFIKFPKSQF